VSSVGQALGMAVGGVIGAFTPVGFIVGAQIGGMVGGYLDPPKGPNTQGPRLTDLKQQTSSYGVPIPRLYGKDAVFGNVFWIENNQIKEVATKKKTGGKGGGSKGSFTEYSYYGTFALGVCLGPVAAIRRIWIGGKLFYNGVTGSIPTLIESTQRGAYFTAYLGTDTQEPDPRMQAALGIPNTPAYRGLCYIVFNDFPLADYGNTIVGMQIKVEVLTSVTHSPQIIEAAYNWTGWGSVPPRMIGVVDGLIEIQQIDGSGLTHRVLPGGMAVVDAVYKPLAAPPLMADNLESGAWATIGMINDLAYYAKHVSSKDYHGWGSGTIAFGSLVLHSSGMELVGSRIDSGIIAARISDGLSSSWYPKSVAIDVRGIGLFVISTDDRWYFIENDGTLISRGTVYSPLQGGEIAGAFGPGNGQWAWFTANRVCTFDSYFMRYVVYFYTLLAWNVDVSGVLVEDSRTPLHAGMDINERSGQSTIWMDGNLVFGLVVNPAGNTIFIADLDHVSEGSPANVRDIVAAECALSRFLDPSDIDVSELDKEITGYTVGSVSQLRAPIEQLQAFYPFDVFQDGYKIRFRPRGGASLATWHASDLVIEDSSSAILTRVRETDSQLPVKVSVKYSDFAREYDISEQYAERHDGDLANVRVIELPIVMSAHEAAGIAQALLYLYWLERYDISFTLPPTARRHQPSDVITLATEDETLLVRLVTAEDFPDGRLSCTAKLAGQTLYTPAAVGEVTSTPSSVLTPSGPTMAALLDVPYLMAGMDQPGFVAAMYSPMPSWSGGAFYNSNDGGESWDAIRAVTENATAGMATTVLAAAASYQIVDAINTVTIRLNHGTLASVTLLAMFNGANHFALGAHGRWEICAAQTVVDHGDGTYTLSNLMRGRFGTEQYGSAHTATDTLVLLDSADLAFITVPIGNLGLQKLWRAVGRDKTLDSASDIAFTYTAENLKCRAPIRLGGSRNPITLDWTLEWTRRSRTPVEPFSGLATPLGEASESYLVEIWDAGFATLKRTLGPVSSPSAGYSQAQQIADFGAKQQTVNFRVRQISGTVGQGYAASNTVTHSLLDDPFADSVVALVRMVGAEATTVFTDDKGATVTTYGNTYITRTDSDFPDGCGVFDGSGDYLTLPTSTAYNLGANTATVEAFVKLAVMPSSDAWPSNWSSHMELVGRGVPSASPGWGLIVGQTKVLVNVNDSQQASYLHGMSAGVKYHVAFCLDNGTLRTFVGGQLKATSTGITMSQVFTNPLYIGCETGEGAWLNGKLGGVRVTKAARYTANFTPPTEF